MTSSVLEKDYIEPTRPYSQAELKFNREKLYKNLQEADVTCITISKRLVLPKFHDHELACGQSNALGYKLK